MKRLFTLCIGTLIVITSCQKSTVVPAEKKPVSSSVLQGVKADAVTIFNNRFDLNLADVGVAQASPCTGEQLKIVSGIYHADMRILINSKKLSVTQHGNTSDYKLVGLTSGARYTASVISDNREDIILINGSVTIVITESAVLTTPGGGNNSIAKFDLHETFDANGSIKVVVDNFRAVCK
jgi:hypothetical protein